jgi:hypothetical protein
VAVAETGTRSPSSELGAGLRDRLQAQELVREAEELALEAISPELVLVAPLEEARRARELLPELPVWRRPADVLPIPAPGPRAEPRRIRGWLGSMSFLAFCVVDTVIPFVFVLWRG